MRFFIPPTELTRLINEKIRFDLFLLGVLTNAYNFSHTISVAFSWNENKQFIAHFICTR